jgi:uncharacterized protein (DUF2126 family)
LTLSLNVGSSDTQTFSKDAYLDLSKSYTYNWNNSPNYTKKDNQANKLLKQVAERIGIFIGFLVNAAFDIADGLVFKLTFNTGGNFITKLAGVV